MSLCTTSPTVPAAVPSLLSTLHQPCLSDLKFFADGTENTYGVRGRKQTQYEIPFPFTFFFTFFHGGKIREKHINLQASFLSPAAIMLLGGEAVFKSVQCSKVNLRKTQQLLIFSFQFPYFLFFYFSIVASCQSYFTWCVSL